MQTMVEELYQDRKKGERGGPSHADGSLSSPSSSLSCLDGSLPSPFEKQKAKIDFNVPQLNIDINFELPMYNGELNAEKLDNWICQIEVYYRIQNFTEDNIKIQLDSL